MRGNRRLVVFPMHSEPHKYAKSTETPVFLRETRTFELEGDFKNNIWLGFPQSKCDFPAIQVTSAIISSCPRTRFQPYTSIMFHHGMGSQNMCMYINGMYLFIYIYIYVYSTYIYIYTSRNMSICICKDVRASDPLRKKSRSHVCIYVYTYIRIYQPI